MRILLVVAALLLAIAIAGAVWLYAGTKPEFVVPSGDIRITDRGTVVRSFSAESAEADPIPLWFQQHRNGWSPSFVTYAPHLKVSADTFDINILEGSIVVNYVRNRPRIWMQVTRPLSPDEQAFWHEYTKQPRKANHAMERTADGCTLHF